MLSGFVCIQSIFSGTNLDTLITLVSTDGLHVLGFNMVYDMMTLFCMVVTYQTQKRIRGKLLHVFLQTTLHHSIVCTSYRKKIKQNKNEDEILLLFIRYII